MHACWYSLQAPDGRYLRPDITDNKDATVTVHYTPEDVGKYNAKIKYGGDPIPGSPFEVNTRPSGDASKCQITGKGSSEMVMQWVCRVHKSYKPFFSRSWFCCKLRLYPYLTMKSGIYDVAYCCIWHTDAKKRVVVDEECVITVDTQDAGQGNITCRIRTPTDTDADIDIIDNNDGTVSIFFTPHTPGTYHQSPQVYLPILKPVTLCKSLRDVYGMVGRTQMWQEICGLATQVMMSQLNANPFSVIESQSNLVNIIHALLIEYSILMRNMNTIIDIYWFMILQVTTVSASNLEEFPYQRVITMSR